MLIFSLEQTHLIHIDIICNRITNIATENNIVASHVVIHYVLQLRLELFVVDEVEIDLVVRADVHTDVATHKEDHTFVVEGVVEFPVRFVFTFVEIAFVEVYLLRALGDEGLFLDEVHFSKTFVQWFFCGIIF
tara:strand:- start:224 stop:622 length:399 start_codon:yes stop_codon:yes gene_type:complete